MSDRKPLQLGPDERRRALAQVPLFNRCSRAEQAELAEKSHVVAFEDGDLILREGEDGLGFYVVLSGEASVRRKGNEINRLGRGEWFGEVALIEGVPRTADVVAAGPTVCLGLLRSDFVRLLAREPRIGMTIIEEEGRRLFGGPLLQSPGSDADDDAAAEQDIAPE